MASIRRLTKILRWIARIWTIPVLLFTLGEIASPDPYVVPPIPLTDYLELSLMGIAILGLALAWRWEAIGGLLALTGLLAHAIAFRVIRGAWFPSPVLLIAVGVPAILFLVSEPLAQARGRTQTGGEGQKPPAIGVNRPEWR